MTSAKGVGMPIKLLHESEGHIITVRATCLHFIAVEAKQYIPHRLLSRHGPSGRRIKSTSVPMPACSAVITFDSALHGAQLWLSKACCRHVAWQHECWDGRRLTCCPAMQLV